MSNPTINRFLRPKHTAEKLGVSVPTIWRYARLDLSFPRPRKLSARVTVFDEAELDAWLNHRTVPATATAVLIAAPRLGDKPVIVAHAFRRSSGSGAA